MQRRGGGVPVVEGHFAGLDLRDVHGELLVAAAHLLHRRGAPHVAPRCATGLGCPCRTPPGRARTACSAASSTGTTSTMTATSPWPSWMPTTWRCFDRVWNGQRYVLVLLGGLEWLRWGALRSHDGSIYRIRASVPWSVELKSPTARVEYFVSFSYKS